MYILNRKFLKFEIDLDFVLIAVTTSLKDYRICYLINKYLNLILLRRVDDLAVNIYPNSAEAGYFSFSIYWEASETDFFL
jgi:hypothetical protein